MEKILTKISEDINCLSTNNIKTKDIWDYNNKTKIKQSEHNISLYQTIVKMLGGHNINDVTKNIIITSPEICTILDSVYEYIIPITKDNIVDISNYSIITPNIITPKYLLLNENKEKIALILESKKITFNKILLTSTMGIDVKYYDSIEVLNGPIFNLLDCFFLI